jgi:hypothetical protein
MNQALCIVQTRTVAGAVRLSHWMRVRARLGSRRLLPCAQDRGEGRWQASVRQESVLRAAESACRVVEAAHPLCREPAATAQRNGELEATLNIG